MITLSYVRIKLRTPVPPELVKIPSVQYLSRYDQDTLSLLRYDQDTLSLLRYDEDTLSLLRYDQDTLSISQY